MDIIGGGAGFVEGVVGEGGAGMLDHADGEIFQADLGEHPAGGLYDAGAVGGVKEPACGNIDRQGFVFRVDRNDAPAVGQWTVGGIARLPFSGHAEPVDVGLGEGIADGNEFADGERGDVGYRND